MEIERQIYTYLIKKQIFLYGTMFFYHFNEIIMGSLINFQIVR